MLVFHTSPENRVLRYRLGRSWRRPSDHRMWTLTLPSASLEFGPQRDPTECARSGLGPGDI